MKIKRYKKVNRALRFYALHFRFRKPYQVLLDGTICHAALKYKVNLQEQLPKYLDGSVKLLTTRCVIKETELLGLVGANKIVKQYPVHECGHNVETAGSACILSMVGQRNESRYFVASQDRDLQEICRKRAGVPILYLHKTSPTLEAPSLASHELAKQFTRETCGVIASEQQKLKVFKGQDIKGEEPAKLKRKKRPKQPNSLSCKKKKPKTGQINTEKSKNEASRKRKRTVLERKVRKELFLKNASKLNSNSTPK